MTTFSNTFGRTLVLLTVMLWAAEARATQSLYTSQCASCHSTSSSTPNTCNGCHYHGTHSSSSATDINLKGTTDKASYAPGETVKITINGGYRTGWVRAVLYDQNLNELARSGCAGGMGGCTTSAFPLTLTAPAPQAAGSYVWAISWYGNQYESGGTFGSGNSTALKVGFYTPDASNSGHGSQTVAVSAFTVTAPTQAPAVALNPTSLGFGTVNVGSSKALSAQVQNTGTAPLNVTGISPCSGTPASISWTPAAPLTVAAGGSTSLNVTFAPTAAGALPTGACLTIASNDPAKPTINLTLSGTGATPTAGPAIALNPTSLAFGTVNVAATKTLTAQVQNTGGSALSVTGISRCTGTPTSVTWSPAGAFSVAAAGTASLNVTFAPTAAGALPTGACLTLASNDPAKPTINLTLTGTGATVTTAPAIALNPVSLNFQTVLVGHSQTIAAQVQNTGNAALNVSSVSSCTGTPSSVTWTPTTSFTVAAGGSASLNVTFAPTAAGALPSTACLSIASNDPAHASVKLALAGTATRTPLPVIALDPDTLDFATVVLGTSKNLTAILKNTGNATLDVKSIGPCTGTPATLSWNATLPASVVPGASLPVSVFFAPSEAGELPPGSCLQITSSDPSNPIFELAVTGSGSATGGAGEVPPPWGCTTGGSGSFLAAAAALLLVARRKRQRAGARSH